MSFSQFEKLLVSGAGDAFVKVWNLLGNVFMKDGQCIYTLQGHVSSVLKVAFVC